MNECLTTPQDKNILYDLINRHKKNTNVYDVVISALTSKFHYLKKCKLGWVDTEFLSLYLN